MLNEIGLYLLTGAFSGVMSGILGIGGGIIIVPALLFIFSHYSGLNPEYAMHVAAGTSLAIMVFSSQASVRAHSRYNAILWPVYYKMVIGIVLGTISGAILANFMATDALKFLLGLFLIFIALKMISGQSNRSTKIAPKNWVIRWVSFLIGLKSGLLGIGGGALIVPFLTYCGIENRKITPLSALGTLTISLVGTVVFIIGGMNKINLPFYSSGYVYWVAVFWVALSSMFFAPIGAKIAYRLPIRFINLLFITVLLVTAFNLII